MKEFISLLLIGVSLSMDTFSLSLSLGSISKTNKYLKVFPFLVGIFHFFMPLFGNILGITIMNTFNIASNIVLGLVLITLAVNLAIHYYKEENVNLNLNLLSILFLAFSVSIDSFTVGLGISDITTKHYLASFIFAICSFTFTTIGLLIGKYSFKVIGKYASLCGIILLLILGIFYLI